MYRGIKKTNESVKPKLERSFQIFQLQILLWSQTVYEFRVSYDKIRKYTPCVEIRCQTYQSYYMIYK